MYMGVDYNATEYFVSFVELTCKRNSIIVSNGNLADSASAIREFWEVKDSEVEFATYGTNEIRIFCFLSGYLMNMGTKGTFISVYTDMLNGSHYNLTISTQGDV